MKFTCTQENLSRGLSLISRVAGRNVALPILNNVLIKAEGGIVRLSTTNLELGLTTVIRAKVDVEGAYTVQSRVLNEFISLLGNEKVTLETDVVGMTVTSGHSKTTIKGLSAEEFPVLPTTEAAVTVSVKGQSLHKLLEGVAFAVANDESRPEISGVLLHFQTSQLVATATDSYRLAERRAEYIKKPDHEISVIIPSKTAEEMLRAIPDDAEVVLAVNESQVYCQTPEVELVSRTIEGHYPDYQQIIPTTSTTKVTINKTELIQNIRAASLFCKPGVNDLTLKTEPANKNLVLSAASTNLGEHQSQISCTINGDELSIVFNYRYLLEGVQSLPGEEVEFSLQDSQAPGVIRPAGVTEDLYLLMPIRQ